MFHIENFTGSWTNGLGFCALIHSYRPDLINYDSLDKNNKKENLTLAFTVAEQQLGIPALLDVEDMLAEPDERSVMTYLSEYFHFFSKVNEADVAGRRVAKIVGLQMHLDEMKTEYIAKAQKLVDWINSNMTELAGRDFGGSLADVQKVYNEFLQYKKTVKPTKVGERLEVEGEFSTLQTQLRVNNRPAFVPSPGLHPQDISDLWDRMAKSESERDEALRAALLRMVAIENLVLRFMTKYNTLKQWATNTKPSVAARDCGSTLPEVDAKLTLNSDTKDDIAASSVRMAELNSISQQLQESGYSGMSTILAAIEELNGMFSELKTLAEEREHMLLEEKEKQEELEKRRKDYAKQAREFSRMIQDSNDALAEPYRATSLSQIHSLIESFADTHKKLLHHENEFSSIKHLAKKLEGVTNVYSIVEFSDLHARWEKIQADFVERDAALKEELARQEEDERLRLEFAEKVKEFKAWIKTESSAATSGDNIDAQINDVTAKKTRIGQCHMLADLETLNDTMSGRQIVHNPHTDETVESLHTTYKSLVDVVDKELVTLQKLKADQQGSKVPPEQLEEFKEMFTYFDKDRDHLLERFEFKACYASLGHDAADAEVEQILAQITHATPGKVNFDEFVDFMIQKTADSDSPATINSAFQTLCHQDRWISEDIVRRYMDPKTAEWTLAHMQRNAEGLYDYQSFVNGMYGSS